MVYSLTTFTELEAILLVTEALDLPERSGPSVRRDDGSDSEDLEDDDPSSRMRSAATSTNARAPKNLRSAQKKTGDSDSDFEFDM